MLLIKGSQTEPQPKVLTSPKHPKPPHTVLYTVQYDELQDPREEFQMP